MRGARDRRLAFAHFAHTLPICCISYRDKDELA